MNLKYGNYCQRHYQDLVNASIDLNKGVKSEPIDQDTTAVDSCEVCGKPAICKVTSFYDIETVVTLYCAYDKDRVCDESCASLAKEELRDGDYTWDTCLNEYTIKYTRIKTGNLCRRLGYLISDERVVKEDGEEGSGHG